MSYETKIILFKIVGFSLIGLFFWLLIPNAGLITYATLLVLAFAWAVYETLRLVNRPLIKQALILGLFLMLFDFVVENAGYFYGFWTSPKSLYSVIAVPIEIMILTLVGGYAWALHLPSKPSARFLILETLVIAFFGALGEYLLILNKMMIYTDGWQSIYAFFGYTVTWIILFGIWYKVIRK